MSIKDFFDEKIGLKVLSNKSDDDITADVESAAFVEAATKDHERFVPRIDFSVPANFARFGSAERYYDDAIKRIYNEYPYDGSQKEKIEWHLSSSYLDNHILENEYPRTNGFALFSPTGWGSTVATIGDYGATATASYEYIQVKGGPHKDADRNQLSRIYPDAGGTSNIYDTSNNRESNLKADFVNKGVTVEFWLKKPAFSTNNTEKEVIFDLWNGLSYTDSSYGRLTIEISGTTASESPFYITAQSGTAGFFSQQIGQSISGTGSLSDWKHYAFTFASASTGTETKFYVNGDLNQTAIFGSLGVNQITGSLIANIGALRNSPSGSTYAGSAMEGWGKLSGSIDEFRYWKSRRTSKDIGRHWFTQVGAGTNTDTANTNLGVYYKFNEGITGQTGQDARVLDYSGRISNGVWTGYGSSSRSHRSAIVIAGAADTEFMDPIINTDHPAVKKYVEKKRQDGQVYDHKNNSSLINSVPDWIREDAGTDGDLQKLVQIISSYFDTAQAQIQALSSLHDANYVSSSISSSYKPLPFADRLLGSRGLITPDIFADATLLEFYANRDEDREYELSLFDVKNLIYQNIYNNLSYLYKSKGTEKGLRNLIRCFGIDDELIKINLYTNNETFVLDDRYRQTSARVRYIDFNDPTRFNSTVHQYASASNSNTVSFISGSKSLLLEEGQAVTVEVEVLLPKKMTIDDPNYFDTNFTEVSLFGMHTADTSLDATNTAFASPDVANFHVLARKREAESLDVKFELTGTTGGFYPSLTSSYYAEAYDDQRWVLAVRLAPTKHPNVGSVATGSTDDTFTVNFYGVNVEFGDVRNEFELTGTVTYAQGLDMITNPRRLFVGAHRTNLTGTVLQSSDVKVGSCKVYYDYISNSSIRQHAIDPANFGTQHPYRNAYLFENNLQKKNITELETLALHWNFETLTGSNASGQFSVPDLSSGSTALQTRYGETSNVINAQHSGRGSLFPTSNTASIDVDYTFAYKRQLPEVMTSEETVRVLNEDDLQFTRDSRPQTYYTMLEKSMYQEVSAEMLNMFATVKEFGNLLGEPVNRYRQDYKDLAKLRQLYFEKVRNTPDFEKFTEFYKWFDESLNVILQQFIPASAQISSEVKTVVESHVLERNKYWTKFPTLEQKSADPESGLRGINELTYDWRTGHAPLSNDENENCTWWKEKAERDHPTLKTGDAGVDNPRGDILNVSLQVLNRRFTTPHRFGVSRTLNLRGGVNLPENKKADIVLRDLQPSTSASIDITLGSTPDCTDGQNTPTRYGKKIRIPLEHKNLSSEIGVDGTTVAPFSVFSSSADNTTLAIVSNKEITNLHNDVYGDFLEAPMQGPFTEKYVGGLAYRHVGLVTPVLVPAEPPTSASADYTHELSAGDRTSLMSVATGSGTSATWSDTSAGGATNQGSLNTVDNVGTKNGITMSNSKVTLGGTNFTNATITWDFGTNLLVTEARVWGNVANGAHDGGTWKWQGSTNDSSYTDIGSTFTFSGSSGFQTKIVNSLYSGSFTQLSSNTTQYRYYRLLATAHPDPALYGAGGKNLVIYEADFKIGVETPAFYRMPYETERAEGFRIKINTAGTASIMQPEKGSDKVINYNLPRARYYREETAKRPVNVKNIEHKTGSTVIGNYDDIYQVVQTSGRKTNNRWWVKNASSEVATQPIVLLDADSFSLATTASSVYVSGVVDFAKPVRPKSKHVFVERFSAPGGPESAGDSNGGPGLDTFSGEYSLHNTINYRNVLVRQFLDQVSAEHAGLYGYDKDSAPLTASYESTASALGKASYHKINRNRVRRLEYDGTTINVVTASVRDNLYVQHAIPRSDAQYAWITASARNLPFGFAADARRDLAAGSKPSITFISASDFGSAIPSNKHRLYGWPNSAGEDDFIPNDFVGLNTNIHEPISASSNTLGYPNQYVNSVADYNYRGGLGGSRNPVIYPEPRLDGTVKSNTGAKTLNGLLHHRNGPYGYPMWRQTRTGQHPIARHQRKYNRVDYIEPAGPTTINTVRIGQFEFQVPIARPSRKRTVIEPAVTSKFRPLRHTLVVDTTTDEGKEEPRTFTLKHTYGNNLVHFANVELNNQLVNLDNNVLGQAAPRQMYDDITDLYIRSNTPDAINPIKDFVSLRYRETIYPKEYNTYLNRTRSRTEFNVATEIGWRETRTNRASGSLTNAFGNTQTASLWPIDGRFDADFVNAKPLRIDSQAPSVPGADNAGELLASHVQFHNGTPSNIKPGPLYARRDLYFFKLNEVYAGGDVLWEAASQSDKQPFYDTYDDFADQIRGIGKDYSVIPEFRISDHMQEYVVTNGGNFLSDVAGQFRVDGALISSSADSTTAENKEFYEVYGHSDFLKFFDVLQADHSDNEAIGSAAGIRLVCKTVKKFRPRKGFYPVQRTLQLAELFSGSYGPAARLEGTNGSFRTLAAPFFAPGIMFNTIKSGLAVDHPLYTTDNVDRINQSDIFGKIAHDNIDYKVHHPDEVRRARFRNANAGSGSTSFYIERPPIHRLPFEAILDPSAYLVDHKILDIEPHPSASLNSTASITAGSEGALYSLASHNFFAETANFYLEGGRFSSITSKSDKGGISPDPNTSYRMKVRVGKGGAIDPLDGSGAAYWVIAANYPPTGSMVMYSRSEAFGPDTLAISGSKDLITETTPYTPPYYNGFADIELEFTPNSGKTTYTIPEILAEVTASSKRFGTFWNANLGASGYAPSFHGAMQLTASINVVDREKCIIKDKSVEYDEFGNILSIKEDAEGGNVWVIEPKFETPMLNFKDVSVTEPTYGSSSIRGMWHQYGSIPTAEDEGVFLQVMDNPPDLSDAGADPTTPVKSLADLVGIDKQNSKRRLGEIAQKREVFEAVIAVPFVQDGNGTNRFLPINRADIGRALAKLQGPTSDDVGSSIVDMVGKMQKYVIPPKMDFLAFPEVEPFAMYIFEFKHEFSRQDLSDMWQNLRPESGVSFGTATATIQHPILSKELIEQTDIQGDNKIKWIVFKAKQKAKKNYYDITSATGDDDKFRSGLPGRGNRQPEFSYNWPYDYFSLVELVKMDAEVEYLKNDTETEE